MATRRDFLRASGTLSGVLWLSSGAISSLAPTRSWALELAHFNDLQSRTLLQLTRHIFPHDTLDDAVYALVVKDLDAASTGDQAVAKLLSEGVADLHSEGDWLALTTAQQFTSVEKIAGKAFFEKIRSTAVVSLYNNELAFAHFGYEGSSFEKGGYLNRGFNDLTWLPNPPPTASPSPDHD
jgi:hypothetical protein